MAIIIKTDQEIKYLREAGKRLARVVDATLREVKVGVTTEELDVFAEQLIRSMGDEPAFKGYRPKGVRQTFPATLCVSINEEVVHGIPSSRTIKQGDIVTIDCGIKHNNVFADHARTIIVGDASDTVKALVEDTEKALMLAIDTVRVGNRVGAIGNAVSHFVQGRYGIVKALAGHGVGRYIHEDPFIPNYGRKDSGEALRAGMVFAIEPMLTLGKEDVYFHADGYTVTTQDKSLSAHFEHTVLITDGDPEVLTAL